MKNIFQTQTADLYVRVSTDEQAHQGYSQRSQEGLLRQYCFLHDIMIRKVIHEDHSAKTFNRPEWKKYLIELKKTKNRTNLLLFLKWDRFSRNTGDAYQTIDILHKLGVEPQAIEQPLDLSVPENKMMLAIYLSAPEVENDRRALNVFNGMRRARKEGRYVTSAPYGYANKTDELHRKHIAIIEYEAEILRWAFEQVAEGVFNTEQIFKEAKRKGYNRSKSNFWLALRNPLYIGKIFVPHYKDEEAYWVDGQHEPIIDKELFYKVQNVLDNRRRKNYKPKVASDKLLPLRGFLICPLCNKLLTGSASKGAIKYYHYYHCVSPCKCRYRADMVNELFLDEIRKYIPALEKIETYRTSIMQAWSQETSLIINQRRLLTNEISEIKNGIVYIRSLLTKHELEPQDYREMKTAFDEKLTILESRLINSPKENQNINQLLEKALINLRMMGSRYEEGDTESKRKIVNAIFPENLVFNGFQFHANRLNSLITLIEALTTASAPVYPRAVHSIQFSSFFLLDLKKLSLMNELCVHSNE